MRYRDAFGIYFVSISNALDLITASLIVMGASRHLVGGGGSLSWFDPASLVHVPYRSFLPVFFFMIVPLGGDLCHCILVLVICFCEKKNLQVSSSKQLIQVT